jgi:hypothetical protein
MIREHSLEICYKNLHYRYIAYTHTHICVTDTCSIASVSIDKFRLLYFNIIAAARGLALTRAKSLSSAMKIENNLIPSLLHEPEQLSINATVVYPDYIRLILRSHLYTFNDTLSTTRLNLPSNKTVQPRCDSFSILRAQDSRFARSNRGISYFIF